MPETVAIIGGGASLTPADLLRLAQARLDGRCYAIALTNSVYLAWWANHLHAADGAWWRANIDRVQHFRGRRTTVADDIPRQWAQRLTVTGPSGFDQEPYAIRTGKCSAFQALHMALKPGLAPRQVLLCGIDMGGAHWHDDYKSPYAPAYDEMAAAFETLLEPARERGVSVFNCSRESPLCFPRAELATRI